MRTTMVSPDLENYMMCVEVRTRGVGGAKCVRRRVRVCVCECFEQEGGGAPYGLGSGNP